MKAFAIIIAVINGLLLFSVITRGLWIRAQRSHLGGFPYEAGAHHGCCQCDCDGVVDRAGGQAIRCG